jgi:hypothetical protein
VTESLPPEDAQMEMPQTSEPSSEWASLTPTPEVARAWLDGLTRNPATPESALARLLQAEQFEVLFRADLSSAIIDIAVSHPSEWIRESLVEVVGAWEPNTLSDEQWQCLIKSTSEPDIRAKATKMAARAIRLRENPGPGRGVDSPPQPDSQPPATPEEIAAMADAVPEIIPDDYTDGLWWVGALFDNPAAIRQLAQSPNLWVRRSVARARHLPQDVANLLARDPDPIVRLFLTESCDDAPPDVLLDVYSWWNGSLSFPGRPRNHPNFPHHDLLRYAEDPRPRMRLLALDDPLSTADLVEQFSRDPDPMVRATAAEDPRLSADSAVRLTCDPDPAVRYQANCNPVLPPDILVRLLVDPRSAGSASRNPSIPEPVIHHMITLALM